MFLDDIPINYLGVFFAAIAYFILGAIWYAPGVFGHRSLKHDHDDSQFSAAHRQFPKTLNSYIGEFFISLVIAYILALFIEISQAEHLAEGLTVAFWIWIGFIATTHFSAVLWSRKTIKSFFIHSSFILVGLLAMAAILMFFDL